MAIATKFWTGQEINDEVENELKMTFGTDTFITQTEFIGYLNEAIERCEQLIMKTYEDYFLAEDTITFVSGTPDYAGPSDIYAMKFKGLVYDDGSAVYPITRLKTYKKFVKYRLDVNYASGNKAWKMKYFLLNESAGAWRFRFTPTPDVSGAYGYVYYIRQANRIASLSDTIDIPEAGMFIKQYCRERCIFKDTYGKPNAEIERAPASAKVAFEERELVATLQDMVPDDDNEIEPDLSAYREHR